MKENSLTNRYSIYINNTLSLNKHINIHFINIIDLMVSHIIHCVFRGLKDQIKREIFHDFNFVRKLVKTRFVYRLEIRRHTPSYQS